MLRITHVVTFLCGVFSTVTFYNITREYTKKPLSSLKNALLTMAFAITNHDKFEDKEYSLFDGTTLPGITGHDDVDACFAYMIDKTDHSIKPNERQKFDAIERYIDANLATDGQTREFFQRYLELIQSSTQMPNGI